MFHTYERRVSSSGHVSIPLDLSFGSYILFLTEIRDDGVITSSSILSMSLLDDNVNITRLCFCIAHSHHENTAGGTVTSVTYSDIHFNNFAPNGTAKIVILQPESDKYLELRLECMERHNLELQNRVVEMGEKLEEMYYAPGMPGYVKAKESFESNLSNKC